MSVWLLQACAGDSAMTSRGEHIAGDAAHQVDSGASDAGEPGASPGHDAGAPGKTGIDKLRELLPQQPETESDTALASSEFRECRWFTDAPLDDVVPLGSCATLQVPLHHGAPSGPSIEIFVKRLPAKQPELRRGTLWILQGGPGASSASLESLALDMHEHLPDLDIVLPDHRGVGRSTLFDCNGSVVASRPLSGNEVLRACARELLREWGEATEHFNITQAALDVLMLAERLRPTPDDPVLVWGSSYGGTWLQRILQLDDEGLVSAAVLDSAGTHHPDTSVEEKMLNVAVAGDAMFAFCASDSECSTRLGSAPKARALELMDGLCEPLAGDARGRSWLQIRLTGAMRRWTTSWMIPPLLYRAERCQDADVAFIESFFEVVGPPSHGPGYVSSPDSFALLYHILLSELVTQPTPALQLENVAAREVLADFPAILDFEDLHEVWPVYELEDISGQFADTDIPLLILHGGLDTQTPSYMGDQLAAAFDAPEQQYHFFPLGTHGLYRGSHSMVFEGQPLDGGVDPSQADSGTQLTFSRYTCGQHLTLQFLRHPDEPVDARCLDEAPPPVFSTDEALLIEVAGHTDPWDNP